MFAEGDWLYQAGEAPTFIFVVKSGAVKLTRNVSGLRGRMGHAEFITRIAGGGDILGARAVLAGERLQESARSLTRTEVEVFELSEILRIMSGPPTLLRTLLHSLGQQVEDNVAEEARRYLASVQERIAQCLLGLADRFGVEASEGIRIGLRLSRNELAQLSGTINESLSRHLTELKDEGILGLRGKEIFVKNRAALMAKAGILS
ncbi:MAG: Crp/Fnr family transcriptional regulator [Bdellovibrionaceae bacterium]|nr:Crp/Fnr family transcriptional regulator [Pseudobdellovibrionaceae bacterium]